MFKSIWRLYLEHIFFVKVEFCNRLRENYVAMSTEEFLYGCATRWHIKLFFSNKLCRDSHTREVLLIQRIGFHSNRESFLFKFLEIGHTLIVGRGLTSQSSEPHSIVFRSI